MKKFGFLSLFVAAGILFGVATAQPPAPYVNASTILELPDFIPGVGALYIDPANAPYGPWLSYSQDNQLIEVLYMIPISDMDKAMDWGDLGTGLFTKLGLGAIDHVDITYNGGHPGMPEPHYHFRMALVDHATQEAALNPPAH
jgi:hypothetical protein